MKFFYIVIFLVLTVGCNTPKKSLETTSRNYQLSTQNTIKLSELEGNNYLQEISLQSKETSYTINQNIQFTVDTKGKTGYPYIFYIDKHHNVVLLYPNRNSPLMELTGEYLFPRDFGNIKIQATTDCQKCTEEKTDIYAFLSKEPISDIQEITAEQLLNIFAKKYYYQGKAISMDLGNNSINTVDFSSGKLQFVVKGNSIIGNVHISKQTKSQSKKLSQKKIIGHYYRNISILKEAQELKNTFTYVLFPKSIKKESKYTQKYKRYAKVLELIQELKKIKKNTPLNIVQKNTKYQKKRDYQTLIEIQNNTEKNILRKYENQFILMRKKLNKKENITVESYNYELATQIIDFLRTKLTASFFEKNGSLFFNEEGPFFITLTERNLNKKDGFGFLYLDLSTFNESAITQVIESYKKRLVKKGDKNIDTLEEWHYQLLSAITNFNDNFHFFNVAYAGDLD